MMDRLVVTHFSDVHCVWAYVSQVRCDQILERFGDRVRLDCRFLSVFGDAETKLGKAWAKRGGLAGYAAHVKDVVGRFDHVEIHDDVVDRRVATHHHERAHY